MSIVMTDLELDIVHELEDLIFESGYDYSDALDAVAIKHDLSHDEVVALQGLYDLGN